MAAPIFHMAAGAPTPVAPFNHAVDADGWVFVTGQMPNDPNDEAAPLPAGIEGQTRNVMANLNPGWHFFRLFGADLASFFRPTHQI